MAGADDVQERRCPLCGRKVKPSSPNTFSGTFRKSEGLKFFCNKQHFNRWIAKNVVLDMQDAGKIDQITATELIEELQS